MRKRPRFPEQSNEQQCLRADNFQQKKLIL